MISEAKFPMNYDFRKQVFSQSNSSATVIWTLYRWRVSLGEIEFFANFIVGFVCDLCLFSQLDDWHGRFSFFSGQTNFQHLTQSLVRLACGTCQKEAVVAWDLFWKWLISFLLSCFSLPSMHYIIVGPQCSLGLLLKEEPIENGMRKQVLGWGTKEYNEVSDVREWEGDG